MSARERVKQLKQDILEIGRVFEKLKNYAHGDDHHILLPNETSPLVFEQHECSTQCMSAPDRLFDGPAIEHKLTQHVTNPVDFHDTWEVMICGLIHSYRWQLSGSILGLGDDSGRGGRVGRPYVNSTRPTPPRRESINHPFAPTSFTHNIQRGGLLSNDVESGMNNRCRARQCFLSSLLAVIADCIKLQEKLHQVQVRAQQAEQELVEFKRGHARGAQRADDSDLIQRANQLQIEVEVLENKLTQALAATDEAVKQRDKLERSYQKRDSSSDEEKKKALQIADEEHKQLLTKLEEQWSNKLKLAECESAAWKQKCEKSRGETGVWRTKAEEFRLQAQQKEAECKALQRRLENKQPDDGASNVAESDGIVTKLKLEQAQLRNQIELAASDLQTARDDNQREREALQQRLDKTQGELEDAQKEIAELKMLLRQAEDAQISKREATREAEAKKEEKRKRKEEEKKRLREKEREILLQRKKEREEAKKEALRLAEEEEEKKKQEEADEKKLRAKAKKDLEKRKRERREQEAKKKQKEKLEAEQRKKEEEAKLEAEKQAKTAAMKKKKKEKKKAADPEPVKSMPQIPPPPFFHKTMKAYYCTIVVYILMIFD